MKLTAPSLIPCYTTRAGWGSGRRPNRPMTASTRHGRLPAIDRLSEARRPVRPVAWVLVRPPPGPARIATHTAQWATMPIAVPAN